MAASQKPRRRYSNTRQRAMGNRVSVNALRCLFHPVVNVLREIRADNVTCIQGVPQASFIEGRYEPAADFLIGWCAMYLRVRDRAGLLFDLEPLARIAAKLHHGSPIFEFELENAERAVNDCFLALQTVSPGLLRDCAITEQIVMEIAAKTAEGAENESASERFCSIAA